jgi:Protein of unknown function (DUF3830)
MVSPGLTEARELIGRRFEVAFEGQEVAVTAVLLAEEAPITCENFWQGIGESWRAEAHHGRETGPELWCYVPPPGEELPYENATVFPEPGDVLYYHYVQPPTRDGARIFDVGIYYGRGCSKLAQGWIPGNLFARVTDREGLRRLEAVASQLLEGGTLPVTLRPVRDGRAG